MLTAIKRVIRKFKRVWESDNFQIPEPSSRGRVRNVEFQYDYAVNPVAIGGTINSMSASALFDTVKDMPTDLREEKKPVQIVGEIVAKQPEIQTGGLKEQIKIVEARLKVLKRYGGQTGDETLALQFLKARRKYAKTEKLFKDWPITTDEMIQNLVKKYKVQFVSFYGYSKSLPIQATEQLEKFGNAWEKVVDDDSKPDLRMITDYKGTEHKKDPILLAASPFGAWWHILGAWDEEVKIVDDLVYKGK